MVDYWKVLSKECLLKPGEPIIAAISGGPDSIYLWEMLKPLNFPVIIAHFNHQLRPDSEQESQILADMAERLGFQFIAGVGNVARLAKEGHLSIEEAARKARYQFLFEQAEEYQAQAVATGHTADDQVETILMHLLRGSGLSGLRGMSYRSLPNAWSDAIPLVRPLLGTWRKEIDDDLAVKQLTVFNDPSNQDTSFFRNRLRHEIIPLLEDANPGFCERLWQMAVLVGDDLEIFNKVVDHAWDRCICDEGPSWLSFNLPDFRDQPRAIQRRLFRRAFFHLHPVNSEINAKSIEQAVNFIWQPSRNGRSDWTASLRLEIQNNLLWILPWQTPFPDSGLERYPQAISDQLIELTVPGRLGLADNWEMITSMERIDRINLATVQDNLDPFSAWIAAESLPGQLMVRTRRPGDALQPLGMEGKTIKVSDLMVNQKIPLQARDRWPIVISQDQIVWVPGLRLNGNFRLVEKSRSAIFIRAIRSIPETSSDP